MQRLATAFLQVLVVTLIDLDRAGRGRTARLTLVVIVFTLTVSVVLVTRLFVPGVMTLVLIM